MKSYVKRASKLSVSAHNIEFFTFLSQFACYAFPYFSSACCHSVAMRFCTYSPFVATPLQCVSIHIPYLLPHRCNAFLYIFPICCHTVAMSWLPNGYAKRLKVQCDAHSLVLAKYSNQQTEHILHENRCYTMQMP